MRAHPRRERHFKRDNDGRYRMEIDAAQRMREFDRARTKFRQCATGLSRG